GRGGMDGECRGRAWHQDGTGNCNCGAEGTVAGSCIDHNIVGRSLSDVANPILDGLIRKCDLVDGKIEVAEFGPLASRSLWVAVDQGDVRAPPTQFRRDRHRQRGLADASFALRYRDNLGHRLSARCLAAAYANFLRRRLQMKGMRPPGVIALLGLDPERAKTPGACPLAVCP